MIQDVFGNINRDANFHEAYLLPRDVFDHVVLSHNDLLHNALLRLRNRLRADPPAPPPKWKMLTWSGDKLKIPFRALLIQSDPESNSPFI